MKDYAVDGIYFDEGGNALYIPELTCWIVKTFKEAKETVAKMLRGQIASKEKCTHCYIWEHYPNPEDQGEGGEFGASWLCNLSEDGKKVIAYK